MQKVELTEEEMNYIAFKIRGRRPPLLYAKRQRELRQNILRKFNDTSEQQQDGTQTVSLDGSTTN